MKSEGCVGTSSMRSPRCPTLRVTLMKATYCDNDKEDKEV